MRLRHPNCTIDIFPILCLVLIFASFLSINSKLVLPAGITIKLPYSNNTTSITTIGTITVQSANFIIFEGQLLTLENLRDNLTDFLHINNIDQSSSISLLIRCNRSVPLQVVLEICEIAKSAGYTNIHIATNLLTTKNDIKSTQYDAQKQSSQ